MTVQHDLVGWMRLVLLLALLLPMAHAGARDALQVDPHPLIVNIPGSHAIDDDLGRGAKVVLGPGTALSPQGGFTDPQGLVDGENADCMLIASDPTTQHLTVTLDLGKPQDIASIRLMTSDKTPRGTWADAAQVLVSDDGEHFALLADGLSGTRQLAHIWDDTVPGNYRDVFTDGGTVAISGALDNLYVARGARYVRFQTPRPDWRAEGWTISEIDIDATPGLVIPRPSGHVSLDGDTAAWARVPALTLRRAAQIQIGKWPGPDALSGDVRLMIDDTTLYVAADVTKSGAPDNDLRGEAAVGKDCVELFLELRDMKAGGLDYDAMAPNFALVGLHQESGYEYHLLLNPGSATAQPEVFFCKRDSGLGRLEVARVRGTNDAPAVGATVRVRTKPDGHGYVLEAAIPLTNFGKATVASGMQIGLDAALDTDLAGQRVQLVHHAAHDVAGRPEEWGLAWVHRVEKGKPALGKAVVRINADVARTFNGHGEIVREIFGMEPDLPMMNSRMIQAWNDTSGCFGRLYMNFMPEYGGLSLPGLDGKTEEQKRAIVRDPEYWRTLDTSKLGPTWRFYEAVAAQKPKNVFIELWCAMRQFEADPTTGRKPASLTPEQQKALAAAAYPGWHSGVQQIVDRAGADDASMSLNRDRELYAFIVVNLIAKLREIFPSDARFMVTMSNETNWLTMFWNKPILDDFFDQLSKHGDYDAGQVAAEQFLSQYNPLYRTIKARFPDILVGCPDVCAVDFSEMHGGRQRWHDFVVPILDGAAGLDFFDYHYGVLPKRAQVILETVDQYVHSTRGHHVPSTDSESGTFTFVQSMDPLTQMRNGITNAREWFGWLNDPDLSLGWAAEDVRGYFDAFGQPRTVAMPMVMFQPLRGKYVDCASEAPGVSAVASLDGKRLASVALNDRPETRQIEFQLKAPAGTTFTRLDARMVWHDFKANRTRYARFNPTTMRGADGLIAKATLPAFALCTLEATLATAASPTHTSAQWRHPGDRVVFWLEPGKTEKASVKLPHEALTGKNRRYVLRLGYEHAGSDAALVTLNGKRHFVLPPQMRTSGWDLTELAEFMVDGADLRDTNEVVFTVAPGKERFFVDMVSIVVQDQAPASPAAKSSAISLDPASPDCTISEEPCRTLPDWYVKRYEAAPSALPPILAHWTFDDEKPGVIADRSGHGHDGTLTNGATLAEGMNGQALQLYGKHAGVRVADSPDFHIGEHQSYSIALWLKLQTPGKGLLLHKGAGDRFNVSIMDPSCGGTFPYPLIEGELFSGRTSTGGQAHATTDMSDGRWHHVVIVRDASEEALMAYVDGKYEGSATGLIYAGLEDLNPLFLGSDGAGTNCIHGLLDDVVFYGGALTPKQVADLFANHGVPEGVK